MASALNGATLYTNNTLNVAFRRVLPSFFLPFFSTLLASFLKNQGACLFRCFYKLPVVPIADSTCVSHIMRVPLLTIHMVISTPQPMRLIQSNLKSLQESLPPRRRQGRNPGLQSPCPGNVLFALY
jgi:hypothetical protein